MCKLTFSVFNCCFFPLFNFHRHYYFTHSICCMPNPLLIINEKISTNAEWVYKEQKFLLFHTRRDISVVPAYDGILYSPYRLTSLLAEACRHFFFILLVMVEFFNAFFKKILPSLFCHSIFKWLQEPKQLQG